jgi:hypothetical protein
VDKGEERHNTALVWKGQDSQREKLLLASTPAHRRLANLMTNRTIIATTPRAISETHHGQWMTYM